MKAVVAIFLLLLVLVSVNYSITGNVIGGGDDEASGIFERIWNWLKGLFLDDAEKSVGAVAKVAVNILPGDEEDLGELVACTEDARVCSDGSVVVRKGSDCEFEACPSEVVCSVESRGVDCIDIYQPVCGNVRVECVSAPCDFVKETFSNSCYACENKRVDSYIDGEC